MTALARMVPVEPVGRREAATFHGTVTVPVYPEESLRKGREVRDLRVGRRYGLREAAALMGCSAVDLSAIERGAAVYLDHEGAMAEIEMRLPAVRA